MFNGDYSDLQIWATAYKNILPLENFNTQNCKNITTYITYIACILQKYTYF